MPSRLPRQNCEWCREFPASRAGGKFCSPECYQASRRNTPPSNETVESRLRRTKRRAVAEMLALLQPHDDGSGKVAIAVAARVGADEGFKLYEQGGRRVRERNRRERLSMVFPCGTSE